MDRTIPRIVGLAGLGLFAVALIPAALASKKDPAFEVPREEIVARMKIIGVMPMSTPSDLPNRADVEHRYEAEVVTRLQQAGFTVIKPEIMRAIRDRLRHSLGGLYNPMDGKPIEEKLTAFGEYSRNEYRTQNPVDGIMRIDIRRRAADTESSRANWDGVSEDLGGSGFAALMTNSPVSGSTPALSFVARLYDKADKLLYAKAGGLQVLQYIRGGEFGRFKQTRVDPEFLLTDPARDARAWSIALDPLLAADTMPKDAKYPHAPAAADAQAAALPSRGDFIGRYATVLLVPTELAVATQREDARQSFDELLRARLTTLGFHVQVDPEYTAHRAAEQAASGGFYDPYTGEFDQTRLDSSLARVLAQSLAKYPVAAVIYPAIIKATASFQRGNAAWDGATQPAFEAHSKLGSIFNVAKTYVGRLDALSLYLRMCDTNGATIYDQSGGLQLAERIIDGRAISYPDANLYNDAALNAAAVERALQPLTVP